MQEFKWYPPYKYRVWGLWCSRCRCFANETECPILTSFTLDECVWPWFIWGRWWWWKCHNSERSSKNAHCKRSVLDTVSLNVTQWSGCNFSEQWSVLIRQLLALPIILSSSILQITDPSLCIQMVGITSIFIYVLALTPNGSIFMGKLFSG